MTTGCRNTTDTTRHGNGFLTEASALWTLDECIPGWQTVQMSGATTNVITGIAASLLLIFVLMVVSYVARKAARRKF